MLADYQREFIEFAIENEVLRFGQFELKSGRISPYFFNAGLFNTGLALQKLGQFYAQALVASKIDYDILFGPAYKGIPLVSAASIALASDHDIAVPYVFNRKEAKSHGEGGSLVGAPLEGRVMIVDDVITAGTAIREVLDIVGGSRGTIVGALVAIDRQERGKGELSAIQEIESEYGVSVVSVVKLNHIVEYLESDSQYDETLNQVHEYLDRYGVEST